MFGKINIKIMRSGLCAKRDHEAHEEDVEETVTNHTLILRKAQRYVVERTQETGCQNLLCKPQAWVFYSYFHQNGIPQLGSTPLLWRHMLGQLTCAVLSADMIKESKRDTSRQGVVLHIGSKESS